MTIAAIIIVAALALAVVGLIAWLAHSAIAAGDRAAAADVGRAGLAAQLELATADVITHQIALEAMAREADAYKETARALAQHPIHAPAPDAAGASGVDRLLAVVDAYRSLLPAKPPAGDDRPAVGDGGLPGGAGLAGGPVDADGPATVPEA